MGVWDPLEDRFGWLQKRALQFVQVNYVSMLMHQFIEYNHAIDILGAKLLFVVRRFGPQPYTPTKIMPKNCFDFGDWYRRLVHRTLVIPKVMFFANCYNVISRYHAVSNRTNMCTRNRIACLCTAKRRKNTNRATRTVITDHARNRCGEQ